MSLQQSPKPLRKRNLEDAGDNQCDDDCGPPEAKKLCIYPGVTEEQGPHPENSSSQGDNGASVDSMEGRAPLAILTPSQQNSERGNEVDQCDIFAESPLTFSIETVDHEMGGPDKSRVGRLRGRRSTIGLRGSPETNSLICFRANQAKKTPRPNLLMSPQFMSLDIKQKLKSFQQLLSDDDELLVQTGSSENEEDEEELEVDPPKDSQSGDESHSGDDHLLTPSLLRRPRRVPQGLGLDQIEEEPQPSTSVQEQVACFPLMEEESDDVPVETDSKGEEDRPLTPDLLKRPRVVLEEQTEEEPLPVQPSTSNKEQVVSLPEFKSLNLEDSDSQSEPMSLPVQSASETIRTGDESYSEGECPLTPDLFKKHHEVPEEQIEEAPQPVQSSTSNQEQVQAEESEKTTTRRSTRTASVSATSKMKVQKKSSSKKQFGSKEVDRSLYGRRDYASRIPLLSPIIETADPSLTIAPAQPVASPDCSSTTTPSVPDDNSAPLDVTAGVVAAAARWRQRFLQRSESNSNLSHEDTLSSQSEVDATSVATGEHSGPIGETPKSTRKRRKSAGRGWSTTKTKRSRGPRKSISEMEIVKGGVQTENEKEPSHEEGDGDNGRTAAGTDPASPVKRGREEGGDGVPAVGVDQAGEAKQVPIEVGDGEPALEPWQQGEFCIDDILRGAPSARRSVRRSMRNRKSIDLQSSGLEWVQYNPPEPTPTKRRRRSTLHIVSQTPPPPPPPSQEE